MWSIIVGMVWYFSLQYRGQMPDAREEAAMRSAAEHYLRQKDAMTPNRDLPPTPEIKLDNK